MTLGVVGLVQGKGLAADSHCHILRHAPGDRIFQGLAAPIGEDVLTQFPDLLRRDVEAVLGAGGQDFQLFVDPIHCAFGGDDAHAGQQRAIADDDLIWVDVDAHIAHEMQQHFRAADGHRFAFGLLIALGGEASALYIHLAFVLQQSALYASDACGWCGGLPLVGWKSDGRIKMVDCVR